MKRKRLRNGFGSIKFLGKGRSCPYGVYPPAEYDENGKMISKKALAYVRTWEEGFAVLTAYHAGVYEPGMQVSLPGDESDESIMQYIMRTYTLKTAGATFAEVYDRYYKWKFATGELSSSAEKLTRVCFNLLHPIHHVVFADLRHETLQKALLSLDCSKSTKSSARSLIKGMYKYAMISDLVSKDYSQYLKIDGAEAVHGKAFTADEIRALWARQSEQDKILLIMIYSGFRISEYQTLTVDLRQGYFQGGIKTKAGKGRIVPIHSAIRPLVEERIARYGKLKIPEPQTMRARMRKTGHSPHDTRHTFSALCETYKVPEADRKRLLGHALQDVTNGVYGHRTLEELRESIEMIRV